MVTSLAPYALTVAWGPPASTGGAELLEYRVRLTAAGEDVRPNSPRATAENPTALVYNNKLQYT